MPDDSPSRNPFIRFKQHVDANISAGLDILASLTTPAMSPPNSSQNQGPLSLCSRSSNGPLAERQQPSSPADWREFLLWSPYSPLVLQATLSVRPAPVGRNNAVVVPPTYLDAFEDLLYAASGQAMPSLQERSLERSREPARGAMAQRANLLAWYQKLQHDGVLDVYPAAGPTAEPPSRPRDRAWRRRRCGADGSAARSGPGQDGQDNAQETMRWEAPKASDDGATQVVVAKERPRPAVQDVRAAGAGLFGELDHVIKALGKVLEDEVSSISIFGRGGPDHQSRESHSRNGGERAPPQTEEDLYSAVQSAYSTAERSLSNLLKGVLEGKVHTGIESSSNWSGSTSWSSSYSTQETNGEVGPTREVTSREEQVDRFGNVHVRTEIKTLDSNGEEIGHESRYSVRSQQAVQPDAPGNASGSSWAEKATPKREEQTQKPRRTGGWFW